MTPIRQTPAFDVPPYDSARAARLFEQARTEADGARRIRAGGGAIAAAGVSLLILTIPAVPFGAGLWLLLDGGSFWPFTFAGLLLWTVAAAFLPRRAEPPSNLRGAAALPGVFSLLGEVASAMDTRVEGRLQIVPALGLFMPERAARVRVGLRRALPDSIARHTPLGRGGGRLVLSAPLWVACSRQERLALLAHLVAMQTAPGPNLALELPVALARGVLARLWSLAGTSTPVHGPMAGVLRWRPGGALSRRSLPRGPVRRRIVRAADAADALLGRLLIASVTRSLFRADIAAVRLAGLDAWRGMATKAAAGPDLAVTLQSLRPDGSARGREALDALAAAAQAPGWAGRDDRAFRQRLDLMDDLEGSAVLLHAGQEAGAALDAELAPWLEEAGLDLLRSRRL